MNQLLINLFAAVSAATDNPSHLETLSNSQVLIALIGVIGSISGVVVTYYLSTKKPRSKARAKTASDNANELANYAGYELLIKRLNAENSRLDEALTQSRKNETRLYTVIEDKNNEIDRLKHLHEYADHANQIQAQS